MVRRCGFVAPAIEETDAQVCHVSRVCFPNVVFVFRGEFVAKCVLIRATVGKRAKIDSCVALMQFARVEDVRDSGEGDSLYFSFSEYYSVT